MSNSAQLSISPARLPPTFAQLCVVFCILHGALPLPGGFAAEPSEKPRAAELVSQLGHEEFAMRERAAAELIALELDAVAALKLGTKSHIREIRHRSVKLLALISQIDLERRFELFKNDTDPQRDYGLPSWDEYRDVVGDSMAARMVFVSMHEDESRLLGQVEENPKRLSDALANRCDQLRGQAMFERVQIRIGTTATLLFAATRNDVDVSPLVRSVVYMACRGPSFETAMEGEPLRDVLATLAELWIDRESSQALSDALHLGLANGLKGCLPRAREVFQSPVATISDRIYASLCLSRFGDESDFARLETYLEDGSLCAQDQVDGQGVVTKLQDIALACLVRLAKQEPKKFGFDRLEFDRQMVFNLSSLGFRDEPRRAEAIASWREFRRTMAKEAARP